MNNQPIERTISVWSNGRGVELVRKKVKKRHAMVSRSFNATKVKNGKASKMPSYEEITLGIVGRGLIEAFSVNQTRGQTERGAVGKSRSWDCGGVNLSVAHDLLERGPHIIRHGRAVDRS